MCFVPVGRCWSRGAARVLPLDDRHEDDPSIVPRGGPGQRSPSIVVLNRVAADLDHLGGHRCR